MNFITGSVRLPVNPTNDPSIIEYQAVKSKDIVGIICNGSFWIQNSRDPNDRILEEQISLLHGINNAQKCHHRTKEFRIPLNKSKAFYMCWDSHSITHRMIQLEYPSIPTSSSGICPSTSFFRNPMTISNQFPQSSKVTRIQNRLLLLIKIMGHSEESFRSGIEGDW